MKYMRIPSLFLAACCTLSAAGQSTPAEQSFTVSGAQTWTDTGMDLAAGDNLALAAENKAGADANCSPEGLKNAVGNTSKIPLASAPAGALIAKTAENSEATLVGAGTTLKVNGAGHLYLGMNQDAPTKCAFTVKITRATAAAAERPNMKQQLSSAASVFLKGQFGSSSSSPGTASSNAVAGKENAAAPSPTPGGLKLPDVVLDSDLRSHLDSVPRRVHDAHGNAGDMVNFAIIGSEDRMKAALEAADWHVADVDSKEAGLKAIMNTYEKKDYLEMPMSHLYLWDRMQDFGYEQAQAFSVVASRHHFRIWKAPFTWSNQTVWVGAATHDVGFEKDVRTGKLTHKIDPNVDDERSNLAQGLEKSGKAKSLTYYLPPNPVQDARNASGGGYHSDGRLLVVFLN
ncbi:MAG TPA: LssY C-terminal domain-containing protein [Terriglobales bacterium]